MKTHELVMLLGFTALAVILISIAVTDAPRLNEKPACTCDHCPKGYP